jgi:sec-independent protein translocase protein TatB
VFEIGFSEIILVMIVGLIVLGPERLPVAVKTVAGWIRAMRSLASSVQNELTQELKLQELQDSIKKVEKNALRDLSPELKASMDELRAAAQAVQKGYQEPAAEDAKPTRSGLVSQQEDGSDSRSDTGQQPESIENQSNVEPAANGSVQTDSAVDESPHSGGNR